MTTLDKIRGSRREILAAAEKHGADHVRLFGSAARGEDTPDSDVDFLVSMKPGRDLLDLIALEEELNALLTTQTDVVSDQELSPHLRQRILQEAVTL